MGCRLNIWAPKEPYHNFTAARVICSVTIDCTREVAFSQILLLNNDSETLCFVRQNMAQIVSNALMLKQIDRAPARGDDGASTFYRGIESLFETIIMRPEQDLLYHLTASLKKAILSLALERYHADKEKICTVLGLSSSQFDDEMRSSGFAPQLNKDS